MKALSAFLTLIIIPIAILNGFGGIVSGIWLAVLGEWGSIGYGLLALVCSGFVIGIALIPSLLFAGPGFLLAEKGKMLFAYPLFLLSSLYVSAVVAVWCSGVLYYFTERATHESVIPTLIWSYGVAVGPFVWMAQKDSQGDGWNGSIATTVFAQIGYIVMVLMALFSRVTMIDVLTVFAAIMLVGLCFQFALSVYELRASRMTQPHYDYDDAPEV